MHKDVRNPTVAISRATGHELDMDEFNDRLAIQKGCYILNSWRYGPIYKYRMFVKGPYSSELADDCHELGADCSYPTDVPPDAIERLSEIFGKDAPYAEAYSVVMLIMANNQDLPAREMYQMAIDVKPHLEAEVREASACLLDGCRPRTGPVSDSSELAFHFIIPCLPYCNETNP